jgi:hypothetical protein
MGVASWSDATAAPSMKVFHMVTSGSGATAKVTPTEMKGAVVQYSGCNVVFQISKKLNAKATEQFVAPEGHYKITLSSVPTTESATGAASMMMGSMVVSVGAMTSGSQAWSSAPLFSAMSAMTTKTDLNLLEFNVQEVTLQRGTYKPNAVCIKPATGNFKAAVSASVNGAVFSTNPAKISAAMGSSQACAAMGTKSDTQIATHMVRWTVGNGTDAYTALPTLKAMVTNAKA